MTLQEEYKEAVKTYKELEVLVAKRIAGTTEKKKSPDELLKQQLLILKNYINILEQRLKYEEN